MAIGVGSNRPKDKTIVSQDRRLILEWDAYFQRLDDKVSSLISGTAGVISFNGRVGAVVPTAGDYTASQITNVPAGNIAAVNVQTALNELDTEKLPISVTSTGTTTSRLVIDHLSDLFSLKDFGAIGDGITDDTAAVTAAQLVAKAKFSPEGIYDTTINQASIVGPYWGFGQIRDSANNLRAPWFSAISAAPTVGDQTSVLTAFNGDLAGVQIPMEHRVTGVATAGQPATGYMVKSEISPIFMYHYTEAGHNQSISGNDGRTGQSMLNLNFAHTGQGDMGAIYVNGLVTGTKAGATSFLASPAGAIIYGQVFSAATGAYLNIVELNANDNGFQSAAIGAVFNFARSVATSTLSEVWMGVRPQTSNLAGDVIYSGGGLWKRGLDVTAVTFDANKAALTLKANDRIYGSSTASGDVAWSQTLGSQYMEFNSSLVAWHFVTNGTSALQIYDSQLRTIGMVAPITTDTAALGSSSVMWSDLFLASGGVINWNNGTLALTEASGVLALNPGSLVVNHTTTLAIGPSTTPRLQILATDGNGFGSARYSNGATGTSLFLSKSRGTTIGSNTVITSGDTFGLIRFCGTDGTNFVDGAIIEGRSDGTPGSADMPGMLLFSTTPDGASAAVERMRISNAGNVVINTAAIATNATNGFLYVPSCAGTPTGTPTTFTGRVPIVVDTTNNKLYFYSTGAWRDAGP
jgi:hypothetical protein